MENINVLEILKLGLPGLVFLMSLLTYRLITKEQEKDNPSEELIKLIKHFRNTSLVFAVFTMIPPIIEHYFVPRHIADAEITATAFVVDDNRLKGKARVCRGTSYQGRYLLMSDANSPENFVINQVHADLVHGCSGEEETITVHKKDVKGFKIENNKGKVRFVVAGQGQQFVEPDE